MEERMLFDDQTLANVTVEDCEELFKRKGFCALCNSGRLDGFVRESIDNKWRLIWEHAPVN